MNRNVKRISYGAETSQFILLHSPARTETGKLPTVVILHGGFWKGEYGIDPPTAAIETLAPALTALSILVAEVEYRRNSDISWGPGHTDKDVASAYRTLRALPEVGNTHIVVLGHSAGETLTLSLLLQREPPPRLLLLLAPVGDLCDAAARRLSDEGDAVQRYVGGAIYSDVCPACRVGELAVCDIAVIAAERDVDVPTEYVRGFHEKMGAAMHGSGFKCELMTIEGADHYDIGNAQSTAWTLVLAKITKELELTEARIM